jgi:hypothetical protein
MRLLKELMAKLINAISLPPATSAFICQGCEATSTFY